MDPTKKVAESYSKRGEDIYVLLVSTYRNMENLLLRGPVADCYKESFGKLLFTSLQNGGSNIAMVDAVTNESATYQQIFQRSISLAQHLIELGLTKNDAISICSENSLYFSIPAISALYLGITVAPMNHSYVPREFVNSLNISKAKIICCSSVVLKGIQQAVTELNFVENIILIDNKLKIVPVNILEMKNLLNLPIPKEFKPTPLSLDHTTAIMNSSGTTGIPKGVMLTNNNLNFAHGLLVHKDFGDFNSTEIGIALLPLYHAFGFITHLSMLIANMKMVVFPKFDEIIFLKAIEQHKITFGVLVPPIIVFLGKSPLVDNYDLSSLNDIIVGAAPLGAEVQTKAIQRLHIKNIRQCYGLTEATMATHIVPKTVHRSGTVGVLGPGIECKVVHMETNMALGPNEPGEICIRGGNVMKGYCGDVGATVAIIDADGWLRTGDVGYYDKHQYFYIVDRFKELIKYKGYQVAPAELEAILLKHPQIKDCAVIGKPDDTAGELPIAFVVKQPNSTIHEHDVIKFVADNVSYQKRLHGGVKFVNIIPKNPTGKILRRILRDQLNITTSSL